MIFSKLRIVKMINNYVYTLKKKFVFNKSLYKFVFIVILYLFLIVLSFNEKKNNNLNLSFLYVGDGDAALVDIADTKLIIDGGPSNILIYKIGNRFNYWDRNVDYVLVSHFHADHVEGLIDLIEFYDIKKVIYNKPLKSNILYKEFDKLVKQKNIDRISTYDTDLIKFNKNAINQKQTEKSLILLYPKKNLKELSNENNNSIVAMLNYNNYKVLFSGDIEKETEQLLVNYDINLSADILKVPHHGSFTSSCNQFIEKVNPKYAIISAGIDNKKHPAYQVLKRYNKIKTKVLQTSLIGDINLSID
jgi:competence protein ComEC